MTILGNVLAGLAALTAALTCMSVIVHVALPDPNDLAHTISHATHGGAASLVRAPFRSVRAPVADIAADHASARVGAANRVYAVAGDAVDEAASKLIDRQAAALAAALSNAEAQVEALREALEAAAAAPPDVQPEPQQEEQPVVEPQDGAPPQPEKPASAPPAVDGVPLLVLGIPSLSREYVRTCIKYITEQAHGADTSPGSDVPGPYPLRVRIVVMDMSRSEHGHDAFARSKADVCDKHACTRFTLGPHTLYTYVPEPDVALDADSARAAMLVYAHNRIPRVNDGDDEGEPNTPGARVRRQTRDVVTLMEAVAALYGDDADVQASRNRGLTVSPHTDAWAAARARAPDNQVYFMFMEDDFRLCPRALEGLAYLLHKASYVHPTWNAIRVSYGLNGAIIRMRDQPALSSYFAEHVFRRPPDHLTVEWFAGEKRQSALRKAGRPHVAFRYNVLEHYGYQSSLRDKVSPAYAFCYDTLDINVVFEVEAFKMHECAHDDIWPCLHPQDPRAAAQPRTAIDFAYLASRARDDTVQVWLKDKKR